MIIEDSLWQLILWKAMILRMWHGKTARDKANAYQKFLINRAIPDYQSVLGNLNVSILRRGKETETHFLIITHWDSEESIRAFAGDDILKAKYYPEDKDFLLEFEPEVRHYQ